MSLPRSGSFAVGQRERLTVRLKGLVRQYQRGPGIIKEFLQNADDARAEHLRIVMDWRDHGSDLPTGSALREVLGPALLIANDAEFTDEDFVSIRHIGESEKRVARAKTGRFGLGFNTAYNVTDYPSFLSREWMFCFDPHGDAVSERPDDHGRGFALTDLAARHPTWLRSFEAAGFDPGTDSYHGTIFRLPLRSSERAKISEISPEPFDKGTFRDIVESFIEEGPNMLLFTRHILDVTLDEIPANGGKLRRLLAIQTENAEEVASSRAQIYAAAERQLDELVAEWASNPAPRSTHFHLMSIRSNAGERKSAWQVAIGFYPDPDGMLLGQAEKLAKFDEKAIPEAGVAVALCEDERGTWKAAPVKGRLYCGLPLPAVSGFPVHVNGCFDLDASRIGLTSDDASLGNAKERVDWNCLLLKHAITSAYSDALRSLSSELAEKHPTDFYELWPNVEQAGSAMLHEAALAVHRKLALAPLFRCETKEGHARKALAEILLLPAGAEPELKEPLVADGLTIADPDLPPILLKGASAAGITISFVTYALLRKRWLRTERKDRDLENAPFPALRRRDWLEAITRFIISGPNAQLNGLPLALLASGKLATFGFSQGGKVFIGTDVQRQIFRNRLHWFIDPDYQSATGLRPEPAAQFVEMTPLAVMSNLHSVLPKVEVGGSREWEPDGNEIPDAEWLRLTLDYLVENAAAVSVSDLAQFPLIPDQHGRLHSPHCVATPLLRSKEAVRLIEALEALGIPLVSGPDKLVRSLGRFSRAFTEQVVFEADGPDLIDTLKSYVEKWSTSPARNERTVYGPILDCLVQPRSLEKIEDEWLEQLRALPLIPTDYGLVSASEPNLFVPSSEEPPKAAGEIKLVKTGPRERWRPLFEKLGIRMLDLPALILVLIPTYVDLAPPDRLDLLRYIRDNFPRALDQEASAGDAPKIKPLLANSELVLAENNEWLPVSQLFAPENRDAIVELLGARAAFPNMEFYASGREAWMQFFLALGLRQQVGANDLLKRISSLKSSPPSRESKRAIQRIFAFIQKHWDTLSDQLVAEPETTETFSVILKGLAWLPAVQDHSAFPGFQRPEDRWYRPDELYPRSLGHRVCSQAPLFDGQDPSQVQTALGMPAKPPLNLVTAHFDRLRQLWAESGLDVSMLSVSLKQIYSYFGQQSRPQRGAASADAILKSRYESVPCIWDHARRRFVRPRDCFKERVPFFEPHKVFVDADAQVAPGLDALGRRESPKLHDFVEFLQMLCADKDGVPCEIYEGRQALHALNVISESFGQVDQSKLVLLTTSQQLFPIEDVFEDDAPHLRDRIQAKDIRLIDSRVPVRIRYAAPSLAGAVDELLDETPAPSINREIGGVCLRVESIIRSQEFAQGLRRIVVQKHSWSGSKFIPDIERFWVRPATSISTSLYLKSVDSELRRIGGGSVRFFVDNQNSHIWVATGSSRTVAIELARAIDGLLGEFGGVDLAALEDILRVSHKEEIDEVLDERRVPRLKESGEPDFTWNETHQETFDQEGFNNSRDTEEPLDTNSAEPQQEANGPENEVTDSSADARETATSPQSGNGPSGVENESAPATEPESNGNARSDTRKEASASQPSSSGPAGGTPQPPPHTATDNAPPITPGHGSSDLAGTSSGNGASQGSRDSTPGGTANPNRGRYTTYVTPANRSDQDSHDPDRSQHAMEIGRLAVERVLAFERSRGREPRPMPHSNPGYDVISAQPNGITRYIEVKGIDGPWGEAGVAVSKPQFKFATEKEGDAWLYVVENVRDEANAQIFTINDPAGKVTHFCFDAGWRAVSDEPSSRSEAIKEPPMVGDRIVMSDNEVAEVIRVEKHGLITRLTLLAASGESREVIWRAGMSIEGRGAK
jgi:sacsin